MTNKEAIEIFHKVKALPCGWCYEGGEEMKDALALAIKALEHDIILIIGGLCDVSGKLHKTE